MNKLPKFDRYLIYTGLFLPFAAGALLFGLWLGNHGAPVGIAWMLIVGGLAGALVMGLVGKLVG